MTMKVMLSEKLEILSQIIDEYHAILFSVKIIDYLLNNGIDVVIERTLARKLEKLKKDPNLKNIVPQP